MHTLKRKTFLFFAAVPALALLLIGVSASAGYSSPEPDLHQQRPLPTIDHETIPEVSPETFIVGGQDADQGEYPWQVMVTPGGFLCGGALIHELWVVTAAHCVENIETSNINVVLGNHTLYGSEATEQSLSVAESHPHPEYSSVTSDNDIALLKLSSPATIIAGQVETISLNTESDLAEGLLSTVIGWGTTSSGGNVSDVLQEVELPILSNETCAGSYGSTITSNMVCAGYAEGGKDSCQGDSGGPLMISDGADGFKLAGVVSFGNGCAQPGFYGVYARVSQYLSWISTTMGVVEPTPTATPTTETPPTSTPTPTPNPAPSSTPTPVPTGEPTAENILPDGSFEDSEITEWEQTSSNDYELIGSFESDGITEPLSPPNLVWLGGANNETASLSRSISLTATRQSETTYTLQFFYQIASADICGFDTAEVTVNGLVVAEYDLCTDNQTAAWQQANIELPGITSESVAIVFEAVTDDSAISSFFIDDVAFLAQNPPAEDPIPNRIYLPFTAK